MTSGKVNANPEDVRKLASAVNRYRDQVQQASKSVDSALQSANWHDPQKDKFEARLKDLQRQINKFMSGEATAMVKSLNELARRLDEIRGMRM